MPCQPSNGCSARANETAEATTTIPAAADARIEKRFILVRIPPRRAGCHDGPGWSFQFWQHGLGLGRLAELFQGFGLDLPHPLLGHAQG